VKGQFCIGEVKEDSNNSTSQHLISTHAVRPFSKGNRFFSIKILPDMITDFRVGINAAADEFPLLALTVVFYLGHQRHLFLPLFAHFVIGLFSVFAVILIGCSFPIYYN
jgi:hypothetical protein